MNAIPMEKKRILLASASVGSGHHSAARALQAQIQLDAPEIETDFIDVLDFVPPSFRTLYRGGYAWAVTKHPELYGLGFRLTDRPDGPQRNRMEQFRLRREWRAMKPLRNYLAEKRYDLIVHTHFLAPPMIGRMMAEGLTPVPQCMVITDTTIHRYWYAEGVTHWFASSPLSADRLKRWGIDPATITLSGIPVHPRWSAAVDREAVFQSWNLPKDRPMVIIASGAQFTCGPILKIARDLARSRKDLFVAVLAGRNKKLLAQLSQAPEAPRNLVGIGFTEKVYELASVCSLLVTKSGGIITSECLTKAVPMVLLPPIPGQEADNAAYLQQEGAAVIARNPRDLVATVLTLLDSEAERHRMSENARKLSRPAASTITEAIRRYLISPSETNSR